MLEPLKNYAIQNPVLIQLDHPRTYSNEVEDETEADDRDNLPERGGQAGAG